MRVRDGEELGSAETLYPHAVMSEQLAATGAALPPNWALQDPDDYIEVLRTAVPAAVAAAGVDPASVIGIATDFTACTMVPVLADGTPLCARGRPGASTRMPGSSCGSHHAAQPQADRINELAATRGEPWLRRYGGRISSEWEFAKALQMLEEDPAVYAAMDRFVEAADWIVWQLCGVELRNACTAGYKGILPGRALPRRRLPRRAEPGLRALRGREAEPAARAARRSRAGVADARRRPPGRACARASRSRSATSTRT